MNSTDILSADDGTDPRTHPMAYLIAGKVQLPVDVRESAMRIVGVGLGYVAIRGAQKGLYRLDLTDAPDISLRYYSDSKDYWQPIDYLQPSDITLLTDDGEPIDPQAINLPTDPLAGTPDETPTQPDVVDASTADPSDPIEMEQTATLAESALDDMGVDTTEADLPDDWSVVSPESDEAQDSGLGELFDSESDATSDYAAQISGLGLVSLLRGDPVTIDWDGANLTLYPPRADTETEVTAR